MLCYSIKKIKKLIDASDVAFDQGVLFDVAVEICIDHFFIYFML